MASRLALAALCVAALLSGCVDDGSNPAPAGITRTAAPDGGESDPGPRDPGWVEWEATIVALAEGQFSSGTSGALEFRLDDPERVLLVEIISRGGAGAFDFFVLEDGKEVHREAVALGGTAAFEVPAPRAAEFSYRIAGAPAMAHSLVVRFGEGSATGA